MASSHTHLGSRSMLSPADSKSSAMTSRPASRPPWPPPPPLAVPYDSFRTTCTAAGDGAATVAMPSCRRAGECVAWGMGSTKGAPAVGGEAGGDGGCWCGLWTSTGVRCATAECGDEGREVPGLLCQLPFRVLVAAGTGLEDATGLNGATTQASCCSTDVRSWWCGLGGMWGLCWALRGAGGGAAGAAAAELAGAVRSPGASDAPEVVALLGFRSRLSCSTEFGIA